MTTLKDMQQPDGEVVLLAPEEEMVPESGLHEATVDLLRDGLMARFAGRADVAVFCRLAWFPDVTDTRIRLDPYIMVVFGRPPGHRKSYRMWDEEGVPLHGHHHLSHAATCCRVAVPV